MGLEELIVVFQDYIQYPLWLANDPGDIQKRKPMMEKQLRDKCGARKPPSLKLMTGDELLHSERWQPRAERGE